MKEQLPLKRIFAGFATCLVVSVAVNVAGLVNETAPQKQSSSYVIKSESVSAYRNGAYAPVRALNHEENQENIQTLNLEKDVTTFVSGSSETTTTVITEPLENEENEKYEVTDWWKAELSDYSETLEQQGFVAIETTTPAVTEPPVQETTQTESVNTDPVILTPAPTENTAPVAPLVELPSDLQPSTFYFTSYGYGHGVGLSQNGANFYAKYSGYDYLQILQHYYPGTTVMYTPGAESETISVRGYSGGVVDIISMVCNAEVGSSFEVEAIKAQAIAAYTYIKYSGGSTNGMAIKPGADQKIIDAVKSVIGQAVYYNGSFALTQFYASSGGTTASCKDVFYEDIPYLRSIPCAYDDVYDPNYGYMISLSVDSLRYKIQNAYGITLSSDYTSWIQLVEGDGGYIADVVIDGQKTVDGYSFARMIGLKSGKFTLAYT
ncbi:MAG: hypothetical protein E7510_03770 [Ruminococcus sp.]|nr:hypothetical protein [Ruminococcus sp.]